MRALVGLTVVVALLMAWGTPLGAADLDLGQKVFKSKCVGCHGPDGKGNQKMAAMLKVSFPDLSSVASRPDAELAKFISEGKKPMPSFSKLSKEELEAVVHYVKAIGTGAVAGK